MPPEIIPDALLSPEDLESRRKGEALALRIEELFQTDEGFREWYLEGVRQIEAGQCVELVYDEETGKWQEHDHREEHNDGTRES